MRVDAYILFCDAIKNGLDDEVKTVFKVFLRNQDSGFLLTRLQKASEDMMDLFQ